MAHSLNATNRVVIHDALENHWLHFYQPTEVIVALHVGEVLPKLRHVEAAVNQRGLFAAGFLAYEAAPAFDAAQQTRSPSPLPLLWFGLYERANITAQPLAPNVLSYRLGSWVPSKEFGAYQSAIEQIKDHIALGESYQVNYSFRLRASFAGEPWALFLDLVQAQQADFGAYIAAGRYAICSASPELFFRLDGRRLTSRPMKGTVARGRTLLEDQERRQWLRHSEKNLAENVMIVDMLRNDMGRIATTGSVETPALFELERYPTLWQMTSTIRAETEASVAEILTALFPGASVTGAPKVRTMTIIAELEKEPRAIYTGCIGFIAPGRRAQFNVAIRTVLVDTALGQADYGVGSGITWDSDGPEEYGECLLKARILTERQAAFSLMESLLWTPDDGYFLLDEHLHRLTNSAEYFAIGLDVGAIRNSLLELSQPLPNKPHKVRLLLDQKGAVSLAAEPLVEAPSAPVRLGFSQMPVDAANRFLFHKTTQRPAHEAARSTSLDFDDVLLWNERGEVTEATTANVVAQIDGALFTPPVECGLLPGTFRAWLLAQEIIRERKITIEAITQSQKIFLINSVRKWRRAVLTPASRLSALRAQE